MTYININNLPSERYNFINRKISNPDYSTNLSQHKRCANQSNKGDLNIKLISHGSDSYTEDERHFNNLHSNRNVRIHDSLDSFLYTADDKTLKSYLNNLAKHYDDIDRRIRRAENAVSQMEELEKSKHNYVQVFNTVPANNSFSKTTDLPHYKKNYVTELKINMLENLTNEPVTKVKNNIFSSCEMSPIFSNCGINSQRHGQDSIYRKNAISSVNSIISDRSNFLKSKCLTLSSCHNYTNVTNECQSLKTKTSSVSNSDLLDLEETNVSPIKIFNPNYHMNEKVTLDKEVQTAQILRYNLLSPCLYEEKSCQINIPSISLLKSKIDVSTGAESDNSEPKIKLNRLKSMTSVKKSKETDSDVSQNENDHIKVKSNKEILLADNNTLKFLYSINKNSKLNSRNNNLPNLKNNVIKSFEQSGHIDLKLDQPEPKESKNQKENMQKLKTHKISPYQTLIGDDKEFESKVEFSSNLNHSQENGKDNTSFEIQQLLENLGSHLQASMHMREQRETLIKSPTSADSSTMSFWDNPLCKNDLMTTKKTQIMKNSKNSDDVSKKIKRKNNMINSELQAICKTIENNKKYDKNCVNVGQFSSSDDESSIIRKRKKQNLRSESLDNRKVGKPLLSPNHPVIKIKKSTSNINLSGDSKFPCNFSVLRSFELNPYDDMIKAHLNPVDRRVKSVAAKNGCQILIDGPINSYDPLSCQAFRNKVIYRCTIAGPNKENLDKCMNYLKETFPNTFLKINARTG